MSYEGLTPKQDKDLREQTIDAVKEGTALPIHEGMQDPEIVAAFKERLEGMSKEEFDQLAEELMSCSQEIIGQTIYSDGSAAGIVDSVKYNKLFAKYGTIASLFQAGAAGSFLTSGDAGVAAFAAISALFIAYNSLSAGTAARLGEAKIEQVKKSTEAILNAMDQVQTENYQV